MPKCQQVFPDKNFHPLKQQAELVFEPKTQSLTQKSRYSVLENCNSSQHIPKEWDFAHRYLCALQLLKSVTFEELTFLYKENKPQAGREHNL